VLFRFCVWAPESRRGAAAELVTGRVRAAYGRAFQLVDDLLDGGRDECSILCVTDEAGARARVRDEVARSSSRTVRRAARTCAVSLPRRPGVR
jgi:hypothetical protein